MTAAATARRKVRTRRTLGLVSLLLTAATIALPSVPIANAASSASPDPGAFVITDTETQPAGGGDCEFGDNKKEQRAVGAAKDGTVMPLAVAAPPASVDEEVPGTETPAAGGGGAGLGHDEEEQRAIGAADDGIGPTSHEVQRSLEIGEWYVDFIEDTFKAMYGSETKSVEYQVEFTSGRNFSVGLYNYNCEQLLDYSQYFEGPLNMTVDSNYTGNSRDRLTIVANFVDHIQSTDLFQTFNGRTQASIKICARVDLFLNEIKMSFQKINSAVNLNAGLVNFSMGIDLDNDNRGRLVSSAASTLVPGPLNCSNTVLLTEGSLETTLCFIRKSGTAKPELSFFEPDCKIPLSVIDVRTKGDPNITSTDPVTLMKVKVRLNATELIKKDSVYDSTTGELTTCVKADTGPAASSGRRRSQRALFLPEPPSQAGLRQDQQRRLSGQGCEGGEVAIFYPLSVVYDPNAEPGESMSTTADPKEAVYYCVDAAAVILTSNVNFNYEIEACQCQDGARTCANETPTLRQNMPLRLCLKSPKEVLFQVIRSVTIGDTAGDNIFRPVANEEVHILSNVILQGRDAYIDSIVPSEFFLTGNTVTVTGFAGLEFSESRRRYLAKAGELDSALRLLKGWRPPDNFRIDVALQPLDTGDNDVKHWGEEVEQLGEVVPPQKVLPDALLMSGGWIESHLQRIVLLPSALLAGILILL